MSHRARHLSLWLAALVVSPLLVLSAIALCVIVAWTGAGKWVLIAFPLACKAGETA